MEFEDPKPLTADELIIKLKNSGVELSDDVQRDIKTIKRIGYYKLKEIAQYHLTDQSTNITFKELIEKYYLDKELRVNTLYVIEDIEIYLHNCMGELLGNKYGAFGYLSFNNWCDRRRYSSEEIKKAERNFTNRLLRKVKKGKILDLKYKKNINVHGLPTIWLTMEMLTLGELVHIYKLMSLNNQKKIARKFKASPTELLSWLECLNLIRNICCHNSNLVNIKLATRPKIPNKYKEFLYYFDGKETDRIALPLVIVKRMMDEVNPKHEYDKLNVVLSKLIGKKKKLNSELLNKNAELLGFKRASDIENIFRKHNPRNKRRSARKKKRH